MKCRANRYIRKIADNMELKNPEGIPFKFQKSCEIARIGQMS